MDNTENKQMLELLAKLNRQQVRLAWVQCVFSAICLLCCAAVAVMIYTALPKVNRIVSRTEQLVSQAEDFVGQAEDVMGNLQTVSDQLSNLDVGTLMGDMGNILEDMGGLLDNVESLIGNVDSLVNTSQSGVQSTLEKLDKIDFDKLNKAIDDLSAVIEPLAKFFKGLR